MIFSFSNKPGVNKKLLNLTNKQKIYKKIPKFNTPNSNTPNSNTPNSNTPNSNTPTSQKTLVLYIYHVYNNRVKAFIKKCIFDDDNVDFIIISNINNQNNNNNFLKTISKKKM